MNVDKLNEAYRAILSTILADMEQRRADLDKEIEGMRAAITSAGGEPGAGAGSFGSSSTTGERVIGEPVIQTDTFFGKTVGEAARMYLEMVGVKRHVSAIMDALNRGGVKVTAQSIGTLLRRRAEDQHDLVNVARGEWGLPEWYGNKAKRKKSGKKQGAGAVDVDEAATDETPEESEEMAALAATSTAPDEDVPF